VGLLLLFVPAAVNCMPDFDLLSALLGAAVSACVVERVCMVWHDVAAGVVVGAFAAC
jgi:putative effector of murein hydrolase LrgA (UPF0299 family)